MPLTEYPDPFHAADETVTSADVAVRVPVKAVLLPTTTLPKFNVEGETARLPLDDVVFAPAPPETPAQPASAKAVTSAASVQTRRGPELRVLSIVKLSF